MDIEEIVSGAVTQLTTGGHIGSLVIIILLIIVAVILFSKPIRMILKVLLNTALGFVALLAVNFIGGFIGITITVNWISALIVAIFGIPGVCIMFALNWLSSL